MVNAPLFREKSGELRCDKRCGDQKDDRRKEEEEDQSWTEESRRGEVADAVDRCDDEEDEGEQGRSFSAYSALLKVMHRLPHLWDLAQ